MTDFFQIVEYIGVFVFALSGSVMAVRKKMDLYGSAILALLTAMGGGLIRDMLIGNIPPVVLVQPEYALIALSGSVCVYFFYSFMDRFQYPLRILDAIGLGLFTIGGVRLGLDFDLPWYSAVAVGLITGTGGGVLRDVLSREVPLILQREIYAVASLGGALLFVLIEKSSVLPSELGVISPIVAVLFIVVVRIFSVYRDWHLPRARQGE